MTTFREVAQQIRDRADIVEVIRGYMELRRAGTQWKGLCPFHKEKTPSFHVHPARQGWHCFGCGKGGSVIDFVMGVEKLEFVEAAELLARRLGIEMPQRYARDPEKAKEGEKKRDLLLTLNSWALQWFRSNLKSDPHGAAAAYVRKRKIRPDLIDAFQLGFSPDAWQGLLDAAAAKGFAEDLLVEAGLVVRNAESGRVYDRFRGRLMFPILDHLSRCIGFGGRIIVPDPEKKQPKYINSSETPLYQKGKSLYGLYQAQSAIEKKGRAILVEGYLDCMMCHQGGFTEAVASLGTALTPDQARLLRRFCRQIVFVYDGDEAGQNAMKRGAEVLVRAGLQARVAVLPPEDDPDSLILREGSEGFERFVDGAVDIYEYFLQLAFPKDGATEIIHRIAAVDSIAPLLMALEDPVERSLRIQAVAKVVGVETPAIEAYLARRERRAGGGGAARGGVGPVGPVGPVRPVRPVRPGGPGDGLAGPDGSFAAEEYGGAGPVPEYYDPDGAYGEGAEVVQRTPAIPLMELGLLRGVVEDDLLLPWIQANIDPVWLDPSVSDLVGSVMELKQRQEFDPIEFYAAIGDDRLRNVYASALFKDDLTPPRGDKEWQEIRLRLEVRYKKLITAELLASLQSLQSQDPHHPLPAETLARFEALTREAHDAVRLLERKGLLVRTAIRFM